MYEKILQIRFISDWHVGSGLGNGAVADAVLARDARGIPCIPGSAIKGALREGAWRLGLCSPHLAQLPDFLFGTASEARVTNRPGLLIIGRGTLDPTLCQWLEYQPDFMEDLTVIRQQTRLDSRKMVVPHSLRSIECGIPGLLFTASVSAAIPADASPWLSACLGAICACVKSIGGYRSRGIGRMKMTLDGKTNPELPGDIPPSLLALKESRREHENS